MRKTLLLLMLTASVFSFGDDKNITSKELSNGLKVYVIEDHRAPLAWFQIWYNVGSSDEHVGLTGISHALEHMMFKGTPNYPAGKIIKIVDENGGSQNAFTSRDYTCYWQKFPVSKLNLSFEIESDRMKNLILTEKDFINEKKVILEERRMRIDDNPEGIAFEQFMATLALATPYQNPVIGWQRDIKNISVSDMRSWYKTWYAPNNATIVVAGDVKPDDVFALADKYFSDIKPSKLPEKNNYSPVPQYGKKHLDVTANASTPSLVMGVLVPSLFSISKENKQDIPALLLLQELLSGGRNSILEQDMVRNKHIATFANSSYSPITKYDTMFAFKAVPTADASFGDVELGVFDVIKKLQDETIQDDLLERAKTRVLASEIYEKESPEDYATFVGALLSIGLTWSEYKDMFVSLQNITPVELQLVAKKYFHPEDFVLLNLIPKNNGDKA